MFQWADLVSVRRSIEISYTMMPLDREFWDAWMLSACCLLVWRSAEYDAQICTPRKIARSISCSEQSTTPLNKARDRNVHVFSVNWQTPFWAAVLGIETALCGQNCLVCTISKVPYVVGVKPSVIRKRHAKLSCESLPLIKLRNPGINRPNRRNLMKQHMESNRPIRSDRSTRDYKRLDD